MSCSNTSSEVPQTVGQVVPDVPADALEQSESCTRSRK
ncbi:DUF1589 domain-containing protein [Rhodopirellula bahusiensis]